MYVCSLWERPITLPSTTNQITCMYAVDSPCRLRKCYPMKSTGLIFFFFSAGSTAAGSAAAAAPEELERPEAKMPLAAEGYGRCRPEDKSQALHSVFTGAVSILEGWHLQKATEDNGGRFGLGRNGTMQATQQCSSQADSSENICDCVFELMSHTPTYSCRYQS